MTLLSFLIDENLPPHLAHWIRSNRHEATHVDYEGLSNGPDADIWAWAARHNAILVTKDQDFSNRLSPGKPPRLLWIRLGNTRKQHLISRLEKLWPEIVTAFRDGEWFVELTDRS